MKKLKKIQEVEDLFSSGENINKVIKVYNQLCMSSLDPFDKRDVLISYYRNIQSEAVEMLIRWRDLIPFMGGPDLQNHKKLLLLICQCTEIDIHERCITATLLYNQGFLDVCYQAFESIAFDENADYKYRVDACRFLFGSDISENKEIAQECLIEIINNMKIPCEERYLVIAGFISKTGVATYLNRSKIKIPYDESFVYALQMSFFENKNNGVRELILSGQHLMSMDTSSDPNEKIEIGNQLLTIAGNQEYEENIRADAADVVLRLGTKEQIEKARHLILELGYSSLGKNGSILDRVKTIYNNSQNMHDESIASSMTKFIEKMIEENMNLMRKSYEQTQTEVVQILKEKKNGKDKFLAKKALHRVSIDTATFTKHKVTMSDIFVTVWSIIKTQKDENIKTTLENRLIEELIEMGDTCSSGHAGRFVNVLSIVDPSITIGFDTQIIANVAGRVNARIRDISDPDKKASILTGMMPELESNPIDKEIYKLFIDDTLRDIREELYAEFVKEKYIGDAEFQIYFSKAVQQWEEFKK